jgi:hypothetical protein
VRLHNAIVLNPADGPQVAGKVLDLLWKHRADGEDPAHAQSLTKIVDREDLFAHWINGGTAALVIKRSNLPSGAPNDLKQEST